MNCAVCRGSDHIDADHLTADVAFAEIRALTVRIWHQHPKPKQKKRKPGTADEGEGQKCYLCGVTFKGKDWETIVLGTQHRMVCSPLRSRWCGKRT